MYVYKQTEKAERVKKLPPHEGYEDYPGLWTVGFYAPDGKWYPEKDCESPEDAAKRVAWLNGSNND